MREIVLDTETTGLDARGGDRIVEIACLELSNRVATGRTFHSYLNPERDMPEEAFRIHGLSTEFLADKPVFEKVAEDLVAFLGADPLVIHNAEFDLRFINAELERLQKPPIDQTRQIVDTLSLARRRFPGAQVNLDALCRRFEIDNSARTFHGALLDCELLAEVYLELSGGRQPGLALVKQDQRGGAAQTVARVQRPARAHAPSDAELAAHKTMLSKIDSPIWER